MPEDYEKLGSEINRSLSPLFLELGRKIKTIADVKPVINVSPPVVNVPDIIIPDIKIPPIKVPEINIPPFDIPKIPKPEVTVNVDKVKVENWPDQKEITELLKKILKRPYPTSGITQYVTGDTPSQIFGMTQMWNDAGTMQAVSATKPLPVEITDTEVNITATNLDILLSKDNDSVGIWSNTAKDGTGTNYQPLLDTSGHLQVDVLTMPIVAVTPGIPLNEYDEDSAVVSATETTILTYTVPASKTANIQGFLVTGQATGRYKLKVAGATVSTTRTSAAERAMLVNFEDGIISVATGVVITITAYHEETANQSMECNLFGYLT